ncbi:MAG: ribonuclease HII [Armatimonadetes bacterium]|nr:ribonuclease HII [Armatimonadota bacterium]
MGAASKRETRRDAPATHERCLWAEGYTAVAGVDEVGRGAWAGPLVAAAVIMPPDQRVAGVRDSKLLSPAQREALYEQILEAAVAWGVGMVEVHELDGRNLNRSVTLAMNRALEQLDPPADFALIDGRDLPGIICECKAVTDGDARCYSIAAASIVAKVWRDRLMVRLDQEYPQYGFARHKGYGTAQHRAALEKYGPCPYHRMSFKPLQRLAQFRLDHSDSDASR